MDRLRRLRKSKSSSDINEEYQHGHREKSKSKSGSSSLVARLMGFDGFFSHEKIRRQHKSFVDHRTSTTALHGDSHLLDSQAHRKKSTEQPDQLKDVLEDKVNKSGSNKDVILDLLKQPNPLFAKHLHGVQESSSSPLCNHLPVLKQSNPEQYAAIHEKVERNVSNKYVIGSKQRREDESLHQSCIIKGTHNPPKPAITGEDEKKATNKEATRIVILKPNYAMAQDAHNSSSSRNPSRANMSKGHINDWIKDEDFVETIDFVNGVEVSSTRLKEAKEIAKKFTRDISETAKYEESRETARKFNREVKEVFSRMRTEFPSIVKEIPGTGGLHDFSGIESASESEVIKMTSYDTTEPFVSRQAKKRLLERWQRAQSRRCEGAGGKGSTLGEMLCIPDDKLRNSDAKTARWDSPLGISSGDGWIDKYPNIRSRSKSLPPPDTRYEQLNAEQVYRIDDKLLMSKEIRYQGESDAVYGNSTEKDDFLSKIPRSSKQKSKPRAHKYASNSYDLLESHLSHDEIELFNTGESTTKLTTAAAHVSSDALSSAISPRMRGQEHSKPKGSSYGLFGRDLILQHSGAEVESSGSSKEDDKTLPVSSPKVPSRGIVSSGLECFGQVRADLCDLGRKLSQLKRESNTYAPMLITTDLALKGLSLGADSNNILASESWKSSYIADVLIESGLYDADSDTFISRWQYPNYPLGPWVFNYLENKYSDKIAGSKYERKLLFEYIDLALGEIYKSVKNYYYYPWLKSLAAGTRLKWQKFELINELHKLVAIDGMEVSEKLLDEQLKWGDVITELDLTGIEIERAIMNDLIIELVDELETP